MGKPGAKIPKTWPSDVTTNINKDKPLYMHLNDTPAYTYLSVSSFLYIYISHTQTPEED